MNVASAGLGYEAVFGHRKKGPAQRALKRLRTYLGRVIRDIARKIEGDEALQAVFAPMLSRASAVRHQHQQRGVRRSTAWPEYKFRVYTAGQKRRMTPQIKREMRRRSVVEPVIGHLKAEHRMGRNYLAHRTGDAANAVLAAADTTSAFCSGG